MGRTPGTPRLFVLLAAALGVACADAPAAGPGDPAGRDDGSSGPSLQDEVIVDLRTMHDKFSALAAAVPAARYTHRVHPDVRSIGEELMHVASANFRFPEMLGVEVPDVAPGWISGDAEALDQAAAVAALDASFEHMIAVVRDIGDLDRPMNVFGRPTNVRGFLTVMTGHLHEHLGKLISDTRAVGVVPPWSA